MKQSGAIFLLLVAMFLAAWCALALFTHSGLIPNPRQVAAAVFDNRWPLFLTALTTAKQAASGLAIAVLTAGALIAVAARYPAFERACYPFVVMLKATPALAFVPLIMQPRRRSLSWRHTPRTRHLARLLRDGRTPPPIPRRP